MEGSRSVGGVLSLRGKHEEAAEAYARALQVFEANFGPEHPAVASYHDSLGAELLGMGRFDEAREHHRRALELLEKAHGDAHPEVAWAWGNLGLAAYRMREYDAALRCFDRMLAIAEPLLGEQHPAIELTHVNKALARLSAGQLDEAEAALDTASRVVSAGPDSAELRGLTRFARGRLAMARADHARARAQLGEAVETFEAANGEDHPDLVEFLVPLAEAALADGDLDAAAATSTRALKILEANTLGPSLHGQAEFVAAKTHAAAGDAKRARALAEAAHQHFVEAGARFTPEREAAERWLAERR
ncbi:MAG: tetratricopeptide repeat protein [Nannocystaceae bacterium]|nr:tetratricopeptide repeat protein [bacterium]